MILSTSWVSRLIQYDGLLALRTFVPQYWNASRRLAVFSPFKTISRPFSSTSRKMVSAMCVASSCVHPVAAMMSLAASPGSKSCWSMI